MKSRIEGVKNIAPLLLPNIESAMRCPSVVIPKDVRLLLRTPGLRSGEIATSPQHSISIPVSKASEVVSKLARKKRNSKFNVQ